MKNDILANTTKKAKLVKFKTQEKSPEILLFLGIAGIVTSTIMACKASTKVEAVLDEADAMKAKVDEAVARDDISEDKYSEADAANDLKTVKIQCAWKLFKLFAPSVILGVSSIGCIVSSHHIMYKRFTALMGAYNVLDTNYKKYISRVTEAIGEETEKKIRYGIKAEDFEMIETDKNGKEKKTKTSKDFLGKDYDITGYSPYAKVFDSCNDLWDERAEMNQFRLNALQTQANNLFHKNGYLFLNDVYDMLGFDRTAAGQFVGWIDGGDGDNFIDFGLYDIEKEATRRFINGYEPCVILDFNVDGNIIDKLHLAGIGEI